MLFRNWTPFPGLSFPMSDPDGRIFNVAMLKISFEIFPNRPLQYAAQQEPLQFSDVYLAERDNSSLVCESDLVPYKPGADIIVNATAHAPGGRNLSEWRVRLLVGALQKELRVTGERYWSYRRSHGWQLSSPERCNQVDLIYKHAYGGFYRGEHSTLRYKPNPIGCGYVPPEVFDDLPRDSVIPAPRIESTFDPIRELSRQYTPEGLRAISRTWSPRINLAGTYDQHWRKTRSPKLPNDFDDSFFQCAHPSLIQPGYIRGTEPVLLEGLAPEGPLSFSLPGLHFNAVTTWCPRGSEQLPMHLDTLWIDASRYRVVLTWRARFRIEKPVKSVEIIWAPA